jgi:hypothetical protein
MHFLKPKHDWVSLILAYLLNHLAHLCSEWGRIHGNR